MFSFLFLRAGIRMWNDFEGINYCLGSVDNQAKHTMNTLCHRE
jgi:hypothetical protein